MHFGICALLVACGGEDAMEASSTSALPPAPPTFTVVGHGNLREQLTSDLWVHGTVAYTGTADFFGTGTAGTLWVWDIRIRTRRYGQRPLWWMQVGSSM